MIVTERKRERGRDIGRGRSRLHALGARRGIQSRSPGSRPGPKAGPNRCATQGSLYLCFICLQSSKAMAKRPKNSRKESQHKIRSGNSQNLSPY